MDFPQEAVAKENGIELAEETAQLNPDHKDTMSFVSFYSMLEEVTAAVNVNDK